VSCAHASEKVVATPQTHVKVMCKPSIQVRDAIFDSPRSTPRHSRPQPQLSGSKTNIRQGDPCFAVRKRPLSSDDEPEYDHNPQFLKRYDGLTAVGRATKSWRRLHSIRAGDAGKLVSKPEAKTLYLRPPRCTVRSV
jgi:hypothetical protein